MNERKELKEKRQNSYRTIDDALTLAKKGSDEAEGMLIEMLEPLMVKKCRHYFGYVNEDLLQQGRIRTLELIRRFDPSKKEIRFLGYMERFLNCFFWDLKRTELKAKTRSVFLSVDEESPESIFYDEPGFESIEMRDLLESLDKTQRYIIMQNVMYGATLERIGMTLKLPRDRVKYLKKKALMTLRSGRGGKSPVQ